MDPEGRGLRDGSVPRDTAALGRSFPSLLLPFQAQLAP